MSIPFSLRIFVADGDPDGLRIVDKWGSTLSQVRVLRIRLPGDLRRCKSSPWQWPCLRFAPCISSRPAARRITAPAQRRPDWIGKALVFPRALLPQVKARPELAQTGVYLL
ncbi:hypothetical protein CBP36_10700 [Acidovorax carolinensis]|uniref:Uncharacterized protein n=1 Tax=Acidovorax carolinensis TaxID=553814 RepID=A0A240UDY1_9BURK|nr:hypothetical protein [Acidovorax carolinensis]ART55013.1 hypothetical protein CBP35_08230 [Acidovorax carolinensis]ART59249.1 hypothetical protein CBP36_10700 [Acidovorax carolinensis]